MNNIKYLIGDVTFPQKQSDKKIVIPHVVNNAGDMGAGVALALLRRWGVVYDEYMRYFERRRSEISPDGILGEIAGPPLENGLINVDSNISVVNMVAQDNFSNNSNRALRYDALVLCMKEVEYICKVGNGEIHAPKFGSDIAGGNWEFIEELIYDIWLTAGLNVYIYNYKR